MEQRRQERIRWEESTIRAHWESRKYRNIFNPTLTQRDNDRLDQVTQEALVREYTSTFIRRLSEARIPAGRIARGMSLPVEMLLRMSKWT